jgi:hypothetical protein
MISTSDFSDDTLDELCLGELEDELGIEDRFHPLETGNEDESGSLQGEDYDRSLASTFFKTEPLDQDDSGKLAPCSKKELSRMKRKQGTHGHQVCYVTRQVSYQIHDPLLYLRLKDPKKARTAQTRKWGSAGDQVAEPYFFF